ncbi:MAG: primosomal protein N', partial [Bacteroidota bacterium]
MSQLELTPHSHTERLTLFADVLLPVPIPRLFTYRVPFELTDDVRAGVRVIVPFGSKKILTGVIERVHEKPPREYEAKYLAEVLDEGPVVQPMQFPFLHWMANYYMCTAGEVLNAALPAGLKLSSQSRIALKPEFDRETTDWEFVEREEQILDALANTESLTYSEVMDLLGIKSIHPLLKSLLGKGCILVFEEVQDKYKPKVIKKIRLTPAYSGSVANLEALFEKLPEKQEGILLRYLQSVPVYQNAAANAGGLEKKVFTKGDFSASSLKTLIKNGIFEEFEEITSRFAPIKAEEYKIQLSDHQASAKTEIMNLFAEKDVVLLQGVTGSGKTEVYIDIIKEVLDSGSQVLYLLPEIALTAQTVDRLRRVFGDRVGVYHSRFSDNERVEVWQGLLSGRFHFIVGVRSAIFLPFDNLGLIVVDEEHEASYKQYDPAPRYHARDAAMVLARHHQAKVLLGSATPSVETYFMAREGKFGWVKLTQRFGGATLPKVQLVNMTEERKQKTVKEDFSSVLIGHIEQALRAGEQVILFQNRRGYSYYLNCTQCDWVPRCPNCDVSLTYHQYLNQAQCHYCGHNIRVPSECPDCGSTEIKRVGFGTEKLEEDLKLFIDDVRVARMDLDTTRKKHSYNVLIDDFEEGRVQVLVGTQMVTKGLDFDNVSLVGIFDTDRMLHFPDFRSHERTLQLLTQVSGRAGRRENPGKVIVQTHNPELPVLSWVTSHDYEGFLEEQVDERRTFHYPPFYRLIRIIVRDKD